MFTLDALPRFVTIPDEKYYCAKCDNVARPPVLQSRCGHRFCQTCATGLFERYDSVNCPGNEGDCVILKMNEIIPDNPVTKQLSGMPVYFTYKDNGCNQQVLWTTLSEHERSCEKKPEPNPAPNIERQVYNEIIPGRKNVKGARQIHELSEAIAHSLQQHDIHTAHQDSADDVQQSVNNAGQNNRANGHLVCEVQELKTRLRLLEASVRNFDLRFNSLETCSYDGQLIWKISNYNRRKQNAIDGRTLPLYSPPFYTSHYGYKICAKVYLNGYGPRKGSHLSLFISIMRGEYDSLLRWPFRQKVTLSLLDQSGDRKHITYRFSPDPTSTSFQKPERDMNRASGVPLVALQRQVEKEPYLRGDTLFFRISVDTMDCRSNPPQI